jgi:hypothetical protein
MCTSSVGKPCGRLPFERPKRGWNDNVKRVRRRIGSVDGKRMKEDQGCVQQWTLVLAMLNLRRFSCEIVCCWLCVPVAYVLFKAAYYVQQLHVISR